MTREPSATAVVGMLRAFVESSRAAVASIDAWNRSLVAHSGRMHELGKQYPEWNPKRDPPLFDWLAARAIQ